MSASQGIHLSVLARNPHKEIAREISYETERRRKARPQSRKQELATVRERRRSEGGSYWMRSLGLVGPEAGSASARWWVSVPGICVGISLGYTLAIATDTQKCQKSAKNFSLLTLRDNPSPCLFILLFSTLGYICYICCIFVKHVKCPWPEMRETTRLSNGH